MKLRFRLMIEGADNTPLANTRVRLIANKGSVELILGEIATNAYGYGIVDVPDLGKKEEIGLRVTGKWVHEVADYMFHPKFAVELSVPKDIAEMATTCHTLDWHSEPLDIDDVVAIPSSFPDLGAGAFGDGYCGRILPSDRIPEYSQMTQIRRTRDDDLACEGSQILMKGGEALYYEVKYSFLGLSLGNVLKSTTLLPCEKITIAVRDWQNRTRQSASQTSSANQQQNQSMDDSTTLNEIVQQSASSFSVGLKVSASLDAFGVPLGVGIGVGKSTSQADAAIRQDLSRAMRATASAFRSERRVSIAEVNQAFSQQDSVRTFCNNNHCSPMTVIWRQMMENYKAEINLLGTRKVVFWPQEVSEFSADTIACKRYLLEGNLLDPGLEACWEGFARDHARPAPVAAPVSGGGRREKTIKKIDMWIDIGGNGFSEKNDFFVTIKLKNGQQQKVPVYRDSRWKQNESYAEVVNLSRPVDPSEISQIIVHNESTGPFSGAVEVDTIEFSFTDDGKQVLYSGPVRERKIRKGGSEAFDVAYSGGAEDNAPAPVPVVDPQIEQDAICAQRLQHHLQCNAHHYSQLLWLGMGIEERRCMLENLMCNGNPLTDYIDPTPLGLWGCNLVFARADLDFETDVEPFASEQLVTLPTNGVFADAALSQCSTCETPVEGEFRDFTPGHCGCSGADTIGGSPSPEGVSSNPFGDMTDFGDLFANLPAGVKPVSVLASTLAALVTQNNKLLADLLKGLTAEVPAEEKKPEDPKKPEGNDDSEDGDPPGEVNQPQDETIA